MKNDRLFQLVYLLLEKGSMSAPVLAKELMEQMIDFCAKPMAEATGMTANEAKAQMAAFFPKLKRWQ